MTSQQFIYRLSSILEHNAKNKLREREKSGKINSGRLGKYGTTNRLFSRKSVEHKEKEYSIALLVDASGSMSDYFGVGSKSKMQLATTVVSMLSQQLEKVKGVSFEITIFNGIIMQAKSFDEPYDDKKFKQMYSACANGLHTAYVNEVKKDLVETISPTPKEEDEQLKKDGYRPLGFKQSNAKENYDGLGIYRIYRRLIPRTGKRIILTFSDGQPTGGLVAAHANGYKTLRGDRIALDILTSDPHSAVIKAIQAMKREHVETIGIGIGSTAVKQFYEHTAIIEDESNFYTKTLTVLSKVFRKV